MARPAAPADAPQPSSSPDAFDGRAPGGIDYAVFDILASMVAIVEPDGRCLFANSMLEAVLGIARRTLTRGSVYDWFLSLIHI